MLIPEKNLGEGFRKKELVPVRNMRKFMKRKQVWIKNRSTSRIIRRLDNIAVKEALFRSC